MMRRRMDPRSNARLLLEASELVGTVINGYLDTIEGDADNENLLRGI